MRTSLPLIVFLFLSLINNNASAQSPCTIKGQTDSTAFPVCGNSVFQQTSVALCLNDTIPVPPCYNDGYTYTDVNPYYYKFTCFQTGTLGFLITPIDSTDDYDWQLFDITNHVPDDIYTNDSLYVACNWSGETGNTGATPAGVDLGNCGGLGIPNISAMPTIYSGHNYLLMVSHFTSTQVGYALSFSGGTAVITDTVPPLAIKSTVSCDGQRVSVKLNKRMLCSSVAPDGSDFVITSNPTVASIVGVGCQYGFDMDSIIISLANPLPIGNYQVISKVGNDNNTILDICGNGIPINDTLNFQVVKQYPTLMDSITTPLPCAPQQLQLVFKRPIKCSSIALDGSQFNITGPSKVTVDSVSITCDSISQTNVILLNLTNPITVDGTYTIKLRNGVNFTTIINECSVPTPAGDSLNFYAMNVANASFSLHTKVGCKQDTVLANYVGFGNNSLNSANNWQWYLDDSLISMGKDTSFINTIINNPLVTRTLKLVASNSICSDSSVQTFTPVDHSINANFGFTDSICPNIQATFTDSSLGDITEWQWYFGNGHTSNGQMPPAQTYPVLDSSKAYRIELIATNQVGCRDTIYKPLTIKSSAESLADSVMEVFCSPNSIQLVFNKPILCSSVAPDGSNFGITGTAILPIVGAAVRCTAGVGNIVDISLAAPLTQNGGYKLIVQKSNGNSIVGECGRATDDTIIPFNVTHNVSASFDTAIHIGCAADTLLASHNGKNNINSWLWSLDTLTSSLQNTQFIYNNFNTKTLKLVVSNGVCTDSSTIVFTPLDHTIKAAFGTIDTICSNIPAVFIDKSVGDIIYWKWNFGNGDSSFLPSPNGINYPSLDSNKNYNASLITRNIVGCSDTTSTTITVKPSKPSLMDSILPLPCAPRGVTVIFTNPIQCGSIDLDGSNFGITGPSSVKIDSVSFSCTNGFTTQVQLALDTSIVVPGNYLLALKKANNGLDIINECGVATPIGNSLPFNALNAVVAKINYKEKPGCKVDTIEYYHDGKNNVNYWLWNFDDTIQSNAQDTSIIYHVLIPSKQVSLIVSNGICSDTSTPNPLVIMPINATDTIKAGFEILKRHDNGDEITGFICPMEIPIFTDTSVGKINLWLWEFGDNKVSTSQVPPSHSYPISNSVVNYTVKLIIKGDYCFDTAYKNLKLIPNCYIAVPSAFTPNGDNKNDYLYPLDAYKADNLDFRVYNRLGQLIFETRDWTNKWDGTYKGKEQQSGTYVWMLDYTDHDSQEKISLRGTSVLIR